MKVAGYVRVSTEKQKKNDAHERQRETLRNWADRQDEQVDLEIYEDAGVSGQADDREAYERMMESLNELDAIVVRELSRLGRETNQLMKDMEKLDDHDVEFISVTESYDTTTAEGQLLFTIMAGLNQYKADLARERTIRQIEKKKQQGKKWGRDPKLSDVQAEELADLRDEKNLSWRNLGKLYEVSAPTARRAYQRVRDD